MFNYLSSLSKNIKIVMPNLVATLAIVVTLYTFISYFLDIQSITFDTEKIKEKLPLILMLIVSTIMLFSLLVKYLDGSKEKNSSLKKEQFLYDDLYIDIMSELETLKEDITDLNKLKANINLSADDKKQIISSIIEKTNTQEIKEIYKSQTDELKNDLTKSLGLENIKKSFQRIIGRLDNELSVLRRRSSINLSIGIFITIGALFMLFYTIDSFYINLNSTSNELTKEKTLQEILILLLPRLSIVIFIEIFAFFFLRLYAKGLHEIKYFQNELTNIESKLISAEIAYITDNKEGLKESLSSLSQTERNFILKKGETTVELERAKSESENIQSILKAIPEFLKNKGK